MKNINNNISSIIGPEMEIDGNVSVNGDLLIYGTINGDVKSDGDIISANNSKVNGNIESKNASISGIVQGNLIIESKVTLKKDAHLKGDLKAAIITLEEGARFDGMCSMVQQEKYKSTTSNPSSFNTANEQV